MSERDIVFSRRDLMKLRVGVNRAFKDWRDTEAQKPPFEVVPYDDFVKQNLMSLLGVMHAVLENVDENGVANLDSLMCSIEENVGERFDSDIFEDAVEVLSLPIDKIVGRL